MASGLQVVACHERGAARAQPKGWLRRSPRDGSGAAHERAQTQPMGGHKRSSREGSDVAQGRARTPPQRRGIDVASSSCLTFQACAKHWPPAAPNPFLESPPCVSSTHAHIRMHRALRLTVQSAW
eukprot:119605-Chlamydomonas_euryale.AAC.7